MASAFCIVEHLPVVAEPWVNDLWLVPMFLKDPWPTTANEMTDHTGSKAWAHGYDPEFLEFSMPHNPGLYFQRPQRFLKERHTRLVQQGLWVEDAIEVVEALVDPLWQLRDTFEAEEQGVDPRDVPHTYDPNDILELPGSDFQWEQIEMDRVTERCRIELRRGVVPLAFLATYQTELRHGRFVRAQVVEAAPEGARGKHKLPKAADLWEPILMEFPFSGKMRTPKRFGETVEVLATYDEALTVLARETLGVEPWIAIDASEPRRVLYPPGVVWPADWNYPRP